jgi:hypothetical protein
MTAKSKRPAVLDLGDLMVKPATAPAPGHLPDQATPAAKGKAPTDSFRTSVFLLRAAHDVLRDIAHEERKSFADLFREGLDHVLTSRNFPTMAELERKKK